MGLSKGRFTAAEIPSLAAPIITISGIGLAVGGVLCRFPLLGIVGLAMWAFPVAIYTLRAKLRHREAARLVPLAALFVVYHAARATSVFKWLGGAGRRIEGHN